MEEHILKLAERLKALDDSKKVMESEVKRVNGEIESITNELTDLMAEHEMPSFTHSGFKYTMSTRTFVSPVAGNKEALYAALRANGQGGLVIETVLSSTLSKTVNLLMEENNDQIPDWLVGKVYTYDKISVRITKSAKK